MISEETYRNGMRRLSVQENHRMRQSLISGADHGQGSSPNRTPQKLVNAAVALHRKGSLTAGDLANIMSTTQPNAAALLYRLQNMGLATSEINNDARIRIFLFNAEAIGE